MFESSRKEKLTLADHIVHAVVLAGFVAGIGYMFASIAHI